MRDNSRPSAGDANDVRKLAQDAEDASSAELLCRVSDETLFQLEQIYEALEAKENRRATITNIHDNRTSSKKIEEAMTPEATPRKTPSKVQRILQQTCRVPGSELFTVARCSNRVKLILLLAGRH